MPAYFSYSVATSRRTAWACTLAGALLAASHAYGAPIHYSIQAGPLGSSLAQFAADSGIALDFNSQEAAGLRTKGLVGSYETERGLGELLQGSGFTYQHVGENQYRLVRLSTSKHSANALPEVTVSAAGLGATTEGTGSYTSGAASSATGLELSARETPQSLTVVTRQLIDDLNLNDVAQVLEQTPGVVIDNMGPAGSDSNHVYVRGFDVRSIQVDGVNRADVYGLRDDLADLASYDRVEVVRGATGLMSGTGDPGASVNLVRKKPTLDARRALTLKAGSWDSYRAEFDASGKLTEDGRLRGRMVFAGSDSKAHVDRQSLKNQTAYGVVEWDVTDTTMLTVGAEYQHLNNKGAGNHGFPMFNSDGSHFSPSRSFNSAADWSYHKRRTRTLFTTINQTLGNGWDMKINAEHNRRTYDDAFATAAAGTVNPDGSGINTWTGRWAGAPRQTSFDVSASGPLQLFNREHKVYVGLNHYKAYYNDNGYPLWTIQEIDNIFTWDGSLSIPDAIHTHSSKGQFNEKQTSAVASVRWSLRDDLSLITGARIIDWRRDEASTNFSTGKVRAVSRHEKGIVTPYVGLVYDINDNWSAYASYTTVFNPQSSKDVQGDYLDPKKGVNYEVGLKSEFWDKRLTTAVSVFEVHQDNLPVADGSKLAPDGNQAYRAESGTKTRGFEVEMAGQVLPNWQILASYTYSELKDSKSQRLQTEVPRDTAKLFTSYRLTSLPQVKLGAGLRWQSKEYSRDAGPNDETFRQKGYGIVDLMAQYEFTPTMSATLNLNNVFDKRYYAAIGSRGWYGTPRNTTLTFHYTF